MALGLALVFRGVSPYLADWIIKPPGLPRDSDPQG